MKKADFETHQKLICSPFHNPTGLERQDIDSVQVTNVFLFLYSSVTDILLNA